MQKRLLSVAAAADLELVRVHFEAWSALTTRSRQLKLLAQQWSEHKARRILALTFTFWSGSTARAERAVVTGERQNLRIMRSAWNDWVLAV